MRGYIFFIKTGGIRVAAFGFSTSNSGNSDCYRISLVTISEMVHYEHVLRVQFDDVMLKNFGVYTDKTKKKKIYMNIF